MPLILFLSQSFLLSFADSALFFSTFLLSLFYFVTALASYIFLLCNLRQIDRKTKRQKTRKYDKQKENLKT